jgi:hydrogenase expression/formation protein HypC
MCLAIPGKITAIDGSTAQVDIEGTVKKANITLLPDVKIGDYVLLHAGFVIERYDEEEAKKTLKLLKEIANAARE